MVMTSRFPAGQSSRRAGLLHEWVNRICKSRGKKTCLGVLLETKTGGDGLLGDQCFPLPVSILPSFFSSDLSSLWSLSVCPLYSSPALPFCSLCLFHFFCPVFLSLSTSLVVASAEEGWLQPWSRRNSCFCSRWLLLKLLKSMLSLLRRESRCWQCRV